MKSKVKQQTVETASGIQDKTKSISTKWNLSSLYNGVDDPQIELGMQTIERLTKSFEKKYRGRDFLSTSEKLLEALKGYEKVMEAFTALDAGVYFQLRLAIDSADTAASAQHSLFSERATKASNQVQFFGLLLAKVPLKQQKEFLNDVALKRYWYLLKKTFETAKYNLSESEESLESLLSGPAASRWVEGQEKLLSRQKVDHEGKSISIPEAISIIPDQKKSIRKSLYESVLTKLKDISQFAESEINALYTYKKIMDERRGYKNPYTSTVLGYENDEKTVEALVSVVTNNFSISREFYLLHKELLREKKKLSFADRSVNIGKIKKEFDFESSCKLVSSAFSKFGPRYAEYLDSYLLNGQIDAFPNIGKTGEIFCCSPGLDRSVYILLNHTNNINAVSTLAHEMGHAVHAEMSRQQGILYQDCTFSVAEVASTFFELVLFDELVGVLTEAEQKILFHDKIMGDIAAIFRQIACFNFELELHTRIRSEGYLDALEIAKTLSKHLESYAGDAFAFSELDGYFFVRWPHIRNNFYVYTYAMGQMISRSLYEKWKKNPEYAKKIEAFLSAGGSMSPRDIFKKLGIDIADTEFYQIAIDAIRQDIEILRKMK
jgi:oligoendopeptidase F